MVSNKDLKAKMVPLLSNVVTQDIMVHKLRIPLNSLRVVPKLPSPGMQLLEKVKIVATLLQTLLPKASNQLLPKALSPNQVISNNHKSVTIHMVIPTTKAHTTPLLGTNTNRAMAVTIQVDHTAQRAVTNHIKVMECLLLLHTSTRHPQLRVVSEALRFMAVRVLLAACLSMVAPGLLRLLRLPKHSEAVEVLVDMMPSVEDPLTKARANSTTTANRVPNQVPVMT